MATHNEYRAEWTNAGYHSAMGSAAVVRPPSSDCIRVYHITSAEYGVGNIGLARLKVARFSDLNDPFELMALNFRERRVRNVVRSFRNAYDANTGLLCFSADWTDPVLWSHYGSKHRGICLGFNVQRSRAQEVRYEDERILAELQETGEPMTIGQDLQELLLCTKFRHWHYEQEWRVFVSLEDLPKEGNLHFYPFDENVQLAEVILGPQCQLSLDAVRKLTWVLYPNVSVIKARLAYKFFKVVPDEATVA